MLVRVRGLLVVQRAWWQGQLSGGETRYTRALLGVLSVLWLLGVLFGSYATNVFALTPGLTLSNYYIWTFVTAGLYDNSFVMGLVNILVYVAAAPVLERSWGSYGFIKFVGVVNLAVTVSIFFAMVALYAATEYEPFLFKAVCGFSGINAAFAVALKQKFGERSCIPGIRFIDAVKFKHLPIFLGWISLALWLTGRLGGKEAPLVFFGTFFSWVYLRFFMSDSTTGVVGDLRAEMSSATFFPDLFGLRPLVDFAGTVVFQTLFRIGFFAENVRTNANLPTTMPSASLGSGMGMGMGMGGGVNNSAGGSGADPYRTVDPTAERRRLLAIKAIDDKLAELARQPNNTMYPSEQQLLLPSSSVATSPAAASPAAAAAPSQHDSALSPDQQLAQSSSALVQHALPSEEEMAQMEAALAKPSTAY